MLDYNPDLPKESLKKKTFIIAKTAIPAIICQLLYLFTLTINIKFISNLGNTEKLTGVGLGNMLLNMCCQSVFFGLNGAVSSLCAQAYGSGNMKLATFSLNRGRFVSAIVFIPILAVLS